MFGPYLVKAFVPKVIWFFQGTVNLIPTPGSVSIFGNWSFWHHLMGNKQLQYTYCPMCHWAIRQGRLVEYNTRYVFLDKSYTKCGEVASPRLFFKKKKKKIEQTVFPLMNAPGALRCGIYWKVVLKWGRRSSQSKKIYMNFKILLFQNY